MRRIILRIIIIAAVIISVNALLMVVNNQKFDYETETIIRLPKIYFWIGCVCVLLFTGIIILMAIFPNDTAEWWVYLIMTIFVLLGLCLITAHLNWSVVINENDFVYRTFWRKTYQIEYTEITRIKSSENIITVQARNKTFFIDPHVAGIKKLLWQIDKKVK